MKERPDVIDKDTSQVHAAEGHCAPEAEMDTIDILTLPFDLYQRYTAAAQVANHLRAHLQQPFLRVLDVGGFYQTRRGLGILPLAHFLPRDKVCAIDLVADAFPNYALASGLALPFGNRVFDMVVSCDTLEHISPESRPAFVDELLRIADRILVLVAPVDNGWNPEAERILNQYMSAHGMHSQPLLEHLENGLPTREGLLDELNRRGVASVDFADGYLPHWLTMMLIKHTGSQPLEFQLELDRYYNRHISSGDRREPAYRTVFIVAQQGQEALLSTIPGALGTADSPTAMPGIEFAGDLANLLAQMPLTEPEAFRQLAMLKAENAHLRQLVAAYEQGRFVSMMRRFHELRTRLPLWRTRG